MKVEPLDAGSEEAAALFAAYVAELSGIFGYNPAHAVVTTPADFTPPCGRLLTVRDERGTAVGCGAVRLLDDPPGAAEIKRMWLDARARGGGVSRQLLSALEDEARTLGATQLVLDTNAALTAAVALYRSAGYREIPSYNDNQEATHWFAKDLATANEGSH